MTTSGVTTFDATRNEIIEGALRIVGAIGQGDTPTTAQYTESANALNMLIKALAATGMPLWAVKESSITLVNGQVSYTAGPSGNINIPKPLKIIQAWNRNTTTNVDIPMTILTKYDYDRLGNKTSSGNPIQLMYDNAYTITTGKVYVFPVPTSVEASTNVIYFVYHRQFEDFTSSSETADFPSYWIEALKYQLAVRLAFEYGVPPNDKKDLIMMAKMILEEALSFGTEEGSLYFAPDNRNY